MRRIDPNERQEPVRLLRMVARHLFEYCKGILLNWRVPGPLQQIDQQVRRAAYAIIEGKGATYYGIGSALANIVDVILGDQRAILTVCTPMPEVAGVTDVTAALPYLIDAQGSLGTLPLPLAEPKSGALNASVRVIKKAIEALANVKET